jgi:hypothetical protein
LHANTTTGKRGMFSRQKSSAVQPLLQHRVAEGVQLNHAALLSWKSVLNKQVKLISYLYDKDFFII